MKPFFLAVRPKTLIASISPILIGTAMAYTEGSFLFWVFFFTLMTGMGIQISCNFANDLFDYLKGADTKERKGPVRVTASGLLTVAQVKLMTFAMMGATTICSAALIYRGGFLIALLVALALLLAVGYTAGPFPLSYLGLAEVFILIFFGPVATGFTYYLQTLQLDPLPFIAGLAPGLLSCAILIINNLRDIEEDRNVQKKTLVVRFGKTFGKWEYAGAIALGCFLPFFVSKEHPFALWSSLTLIPALFLARFVFSVTNPREYNPLFGKTGNLLTLYTLSFCIGYIL